MAKKRHEPATPIPEGRASFLPQSESPPPPEVVEAEAHGVTDSVVTLSIERIGGRDLVVTLTIPPLEPCTARRPNAIPLHGGSPEKLASITADMIAEAAASAREDGIYQHYRKEQEANEAKARFAKR